MITNFRRDNGIAGQEVEVIHLQPVRTGIILKTPSSSNESTRKSANYKVTGNTVPRRKLRVVALLNTEATRDAGNPQNMVSFRFISTAGALVVVTV